MILNKEIKVRNSTLARYNQASIKLYGEFMKLPYQTRLGMPTELVNALYIVSGTAEYLEEDRLIQEATDERD